MPMPAKTKVIAPTGPLVVVTFIKVHEHDGKLYKIGDKASVTKRAFEKLLRRGVIKG
jgi:hypothetical protein